jgi:class 3 adenylate cyclase
MNRFFDRASRVVIDSDGVVDKLVGDEVVALYAPAVAPTTHERRSRPPATSCARPPSHPEHVSCAADALAALEESLPQASARVAGSGRCQVVPPVLLVTLSGA